jgi:hypothetical protein
VEVESRQDHRRGRTLARDRRPALTALQREWVQVDDAADHAGDGRAQDRELGLGAHDVASNTRTGMPASRASLMQLRVPLDDGNGKARQMSAPRLTM